MDFVQNKTYDSFLDDCLLVVRGDSYLSNDDPLFLIVVLDEFDRNTRKILWPVQT
jgi:hypothetical protein